MSYDRIGHTIDLLHKIKFHCVYGSAITFGISHNSIFVFLFFSASIVSLMMICGKLQSELIILLSIHHMTIVTRKEIVWKRRNFFCLCYGPFLTSAQSFRRGQNLVGSFNNIKFWKKYNSKQPRLCFKISQGVPE